MASEIDESLRVFVAARANSRCEYCLLSEDDSFSRHHIDHIVSRKHDGTSDQLNLAFACIRCNAWKGSDIASLDPQTGSFTPPFNPRRQLWHDHFRLDGAIIEPLTPVGRATAKLLRLNIAQRVTERHLLIAISRFGDSR